MEELSYHKNTLSVSRGGQSGARNGEIIARTLLCMIELFGYCSISDRRYGQQGWSAMLLREKKMFSFDKAAKTSRNYTFPSKGFLPR